MKKIIVTVFDSHVVKVCRFLDLIEGVDEYEDAPQNTAELAATDSQQFKLEMPKNCSECTPGSMAMCSSEYGGSQCKNFWNAIFSHIKH